MREQLIAAIENDPDDVENYRVYADWLESNGQPRGQLIQLELLRERLTDRSKLNHLNNKIAVYFDTNKAHFIGALKSWPNMRYEATYSYGPLYWRYGFIRRAEIHAGKDPAACLRELIASASGRFLIELQLRVDVLDVLLERVPASLRELAVIVDAIDLSAAWPKLARLHRLSIHVNNPVLGTIDLPELRKLAITTEIAELVQAPRIPKLETLNLFGGRGATPILKFLDRLDAPATKLELDHVSSVDDIVGRLADTRIGRQLTEVALPSSTLSDAGIRDWLDHPPPTKLARIDLRESRLSDQSLAALRSIAREVVVTQRTYL